MVKRPKLIAAAFFTTGFVILAAIFFPALFSTIRFTLFSPPQLVDPTAVSAARAPYVINILGASTVDYARPESWFENPELPLSATQSRLQYYNLSIPRLGLADIPIEIGGTDLRKNAIHYTGTALPGEPGNTVIFGHSSLPYLYRPNSPLTIFNPITKAKLGDELIVKYDGITYKYLVKKSFEVKPSQVEVLTQNRDKREITLITCVPLGTYWRRLVIKADLVN